MLSTQLFCDILLFFFAIWQRVPNILVHLQALTEIITKINNSYNKTN
jgi:hypothetical protein